MSTSPRSVHRGKLQASWSLDETTETIRAFLENRPEGATEEEIHRWCDFIADVTMDIAIIDGVEAGLQVARWNGSDWVLSNVEAAAP